MKNTDFDLGMGVALLIFIIIGSKIFMSFNETPRLLEVLIALILFFLLHTIKSIIKNITRRKSDDKKNDKLY